MPDNDSSLHDSPRGALATRLSVVGLSVIHGNIQAENLGVFAALRNPSIRNAETGL